MAPPSPKFFWNFFFCKNPPKTESSIQDLSIDTQFIIPSQVDAEIFKKKVHGLAISPNFENGIAPPLGVLGRKFFGVLNNSLGGTSGPSMSKIGDVRVPNHFDPCWNCPSEKYQTRVQNTRRNWKIPNGSEKYPMQVKNTNSNWKIPNAIEKYQTRLKSTTCEWKLPNASEKFLTRVKNTKCKWKIPNASEKYQTQVKNTNRKWRIPNVSNKYQTRVKNTKHKWQISNAR